ncbi:MAG: hypothetical protein NTAFB01_10430 [Nitrospira sp.]
MESVTTLSFYYRIGSPKDLAGYLESWEMYDVEIGKAEKAVRASTKECPNRSCFLIVYGSSSA